MGLFELYAIECNAVEVEALEAHCRDSKTSD